MLEEISESIHARRQVKRKINVLREPGVGAEFEINENMADIGNYGFLCMYILIVLSKLFAFMRVIFRYTIEHNEIFFESMQHATK